MAIFEIIIRLFKRLFSLSTKYRNDIVKYEKRGKLSRILALIFTPILLLFGVGCIFYASTIENTRYGLKLSALFLAFVLSYFCIETCAVYSYCGFVQYFWGSLEKLAKERQRKKDLKKAKKLQRKQNKNKETTQNLIANDSLITIQNVQADKTENNTISLSTETNISNEATTNNVPSTETTNNTIPSNENVSNKATTDNNGGQENLQTTTEISNEEAPKKKPVPKKLDLFVGIYCLVLDIAGTVGSLYLLLQGLSAIGYY